MTTQGILKFYFPLMASWMLMAVEGPVCVYILSQGKNSVTDTAAFLLMFGVSLWVESPVIDLLSTSTTLATSPSRIRAIRRFAMQCMTWCTVVHFLLAFTPAYGFLMTRVLGVQPDVAEAARVPLMIMLPWSAFIGWRRWLQGILIRSGMTREVGRGTFIRMVTIFVVGFGFSIFTPWKGLGAACLALVCSVFCEMAYIHWASRRPLAKLLQAPDVDPPISSRDLLRFHVPLTISTMVGMTTMPIMAAALSRFPEATLHMAAWQVYTSSSWAFRAPAFALPETIISLVKDAESGRALRRFSIQVGVIFSGLMLVLWALGIPGWFFSRVLGVKPELIPLANLAFILTSLLPVVSCIMCYVRGRLTSAHLTMPRVLATVLSVVVLALAMLLGRALNWPGVPSAAFAVTCSLLVEMGVQVWYWLRSTHRTHSPQVPEPSSISP